jgi:glycosyltransferase involved in cell wall biosynthesis
MKTIAITHLITGLNTGGAEMTLLRLLTAMDQESFDVKVISMIPIGPIGEKIKALGIPVTSLGMRPGHPSLHGFYQLLCILKNNKPDILQTWLYHADLLGLLAAKLSGIETVIWNVRSANMDFGQYGWLSGIVFKICALLSSWPKAVIVNSQAGQAIHTQSGYHPKEWVFIPNGIDPHQFQPNTQLRDRLRQEWGVTENEFLIGMVGRFDPMKGHSIFLQAAAIVKTNHPNTRFICIGGGSATYTNEIKKFAHRLNLSKFLWSEPRMDMSAVYSACDLLVSASLFGEGFPNVVAEAMACGKACVVTDVGDSAALVAEYGISVPPNKPEALAQAIERLLEIPGDGLIQLGEKARQRITENFSTEKMVNAYSALYKRLADIVIP